MQNARNKHTGARIVGTLEIIHGRAGVLGFSRDQRGRLTWEHDCCGTDVCWDSAETASDDHGAIFLDADGAEVPEANVELIEASDQ